MDRLSINLKMLFHKQLTIRAGMFSAFTKWNERRYYKCFCCYQFCAVINSNHSRMLRSILIFSSMYFCIVHRFSNFYKFWTDTFILVFRFMTTSIQTNFYISFCGWELENLRWLGTNKIFCYYSAAANWIICQLVYLIPFRMHLAHFKTWPVWES